MAITEASARRVIRQLIEQGYLDEKTAVGVRFSPDALPDMNPTFPKTSEQQSEDALLDEYHRLANDLRLWSELGDDERKTIWWVQRKVLVNQDSLLRYRSLYPQDFVECPADIAGRLTVKT